MRSPMTTNGRPKPMTTSRVFELMTVSVMRRSFPCRSAQCARPTRRRSKPRWYQSLWQAAARLDAGFEEGLVEAAFELGDALGDRLLDVAAHELALAAPVREVMLAGDAAGAHRRAVDGLENARRELLLHVAPAFPADDLGGNVAPVNADQLRHWITCPASASRNGASPVKCVASGSARRRACCSASASSSADCVCARYTTRR